MLKLFQQYPELLAITFVLAGFVAAFLMAKAASNLAALIARYTRGFLPDRVVSPAAIQFVSRSVYFVTLTFFLLLALRALDISGLGSSLELLLVFVPKLLIAATFVLGGYLLGLLVRTLVSNLVGDSNRLLPGLLQYSVVIVATLTGLEQISIELYFLSTLTTVVFAAVVGSLSLAFALGSKDLVANMLASKDLARYSVGDYVSVADVGGQVTEITQTAIVLATDQGSVVVPASMMTTSVVVHNVSGAEFEPEVETEPGTADPGTKDE